MSKHEKIKKKLRGETEAKIEKVVSEECQKCPMRWMIRGRGCLARPHSCSTYLLFSDEDYEEEGEPFVPKPSVHVGFERTGVGWNPKTRTFKRYIRHKITVTTTQAGTITKIKEIKE